MRFSLHNDGYNSFAELLKAMESAIRDFSYAKAASTEASQQEALEQLSTTCTHALKQLRLFLLRKKDNPTNKDITSQDVLAHFAAFDTAWSAASIDTTSIMVGMSEPAFFFRSAQTLFQQPDKVSEAIQHISVSLSEFIA